MDDEPEEYIDFMAKYKDWISIKRLGIRAATRPEEVVQHLAGIRGTIDIKSYGLLGIKTSVLDAQAAKICAGMKKGYGSLGSALAKMDGTEAKQAISESCPKELQKLSEIYLMGKVLTTLGYDTAINQTVMSKIYPDLKVKKPLGRGKGKKEEEM